MSGTPKILTFDLETSPLLAYTWGLWQQNIGINQIVEDTRVMAWSAKWHGSKTTYFASEFHNGTEDMLGELHELMGAADAWSYWNGDNFDAPHMRREFEQHGLPPVAEAVKLDLMKVTKKNFRFPSYKLDYVTRRFGVPGKVSHTGFDLWLRCMNDDPKAWALMKKYCINDTNITDRLLPRLLPYVTSLNYNLFRDEDGCPHCDRSKPQQRGSRLTRSGRYPRFQCQSCGGWWQGKSAEKIADGRGVA